MNIVVVGTGYVGLVSGACLSAKDHFVTCVDKNRRIVDTINSGDTPIYEPGLAEIIRASVESENLQATTDLTKALIPADIVIIAVGTPSDERGFIDLQYILESAGEIGHALKGKDSYCCIVVKSTVIPGTTMKNVLPVLESTSGKTLGAFGLAMNPEFLREGSAVSDFMNPDRVIIGATDLPSSQYMERLYESFNAPTLVTNPTTAELIKYANNSFLAMLISFSNELSRIAGSLDGVDIKDVLRGVHLDHRLSPVAGGKRVEPGILNYLEAGCGYGGSCFPKDVRALETFASEINVATPIITATRIINSTQPEYSTCLLERRMGSLRNKKIGVLGLAFKPETDDVRETPAYLIISELVAKGAIVRAHDPLGKARENFVAEYGNHLKNFFRIQDDLDLILTESEALILVTGWKEYVEMNWATLVIENSNIKIFFDARRMIDPSIFSGTSCQYCGIGYGG